MANYTIQSGVTSKGIILNENDFMNVTSKAKASNTTVNSGGTMRIESGGIANTTTVNPGGSMYIIPGGRANTTTVNAGGQFQIIGGGSAIKTEINSDGRFYVGDGATASNATVHNGGQLYVSDGGKLTGKVVIEAGAVVSAALNAILDFPINGTSLPNGVTSYVILNDFSLIQGSPTYTLTVGGNDPGIYRLAGNAAGFNDRTITVKNTSGDEFGTFKVGGEKIVGDQKYTLSINTSSELVVTVTNLYDLTGYLKSTANLTADMIASGVLILSGGILNVLNGGSASMTFIESKGIMNVSDGGSASMTSIGGIMNVSDGGKADGVTIANGGSMHVSSCGTVNTTTVKGGGRMYVSDGGKADDVTVNSGGDLYVSAGGTATQIVENGGCVNVDNGATVLFLPNEFGGYTYTYGSATIHSGTIGTNLSAGYRGKIYVIGGTANTTTVSSDGNMTVYDGGVANGATVKAYGGLEIHDGGKLTGKMSFEDNAVVSAYEGSIIDFDISGVSPNNDPFVNNLSLVQGTPTCTLTVSGSEATGDYKLAEGAAGFNKTIKVVNTLGTELGTLTVGGATTIGGKDYTLTLTDGGALGVTVGNGDITPPVVSNIKADITGPTNQNVTVTAEFSDDVAVASRLYRIGDGDWTDYTGGVTVTGNEMIHFKAIDTSGNESKVEGIFIDYIDKIAPAVTDITPSTTEPDAASVTVTANFSDNKGLASKQYRIGTGDWQDYPDGGVTVTQNGTVEFKATDTAGNETTASYKVTNIAGGSPVYDLTGDLSNINHLNEGMVGSSVNILNGGELHVSNGAQASQTVMNSGGSMLVSQGGSADVTTVNSGGDLYIENGGTATKITENGGYVWIHDNATGEFLPNSFGGYSYEGWDWATIHSGTTGTDLTVSSGGNVDVYYGGLASRTTVNASCCFRVLDGGSADITTVNSGGSMRVSAGGTATQITENGGYVEVNTGATAEFAPNEFTGLVLYNFATVHSGTTATDATLNMGGLLVYDGGLANGVTVKNIGRLSIYDGGKVTGKVTFETGAKATAESGAILDFDLTQTTAGADALVNDLSFVRDLPLTYTLTVSGSEATGTYKLAGNAAGFDKTITVKNTSGTTLGTLTVGGDTQTLGGRDYTLTLTDGGALGVTLGESAPAVVDLTGDLTTDYDLTAGMVASSVNILRGGSMYVEDGASADITTVNSGGYLYVSAGGTATQITENGGYVNFDHDATVTFLPNKFGGYTYDNPNEWCTIHSGTTGTDLSVGNSARIYVYSGGSASQTTVNPGGGFYVYSGCTATQIVENGGYVYIGFRNIPSGMFVPNVFSGVSVRDYGHATIHSGTTAIDTTVSNEGLLYVYEGGLANGIMVAPQGHLVVSSGGRLTGKMTFDPNADVYAEPGAILDFDLTQTTAGADALVNNLAPALATDFDYTLTVSGSETTGAYKLAGNAIGFDKTITVKNTSGESLGTLTVGGDTLFTKSSGYTLTLGADNTLSVDITTKSVHVDDTTPPVISNVAANITSPTLGSVTVTADFDDDVALASQQYRIGSGDWTDYTGGVTVTTNTTVEFKAVDTAGNETTASYVVTNIIPPVAPDLSGDLTAEYELTAGNVGHDVNILNGGALNVKDGGLVENTIVNNGGALNVSSGGKLTGKMTFENGATVTAETGAVFDFDITQTVPGADALVNDLSLVLNQPFTYTLTVDNQQALGTYKLAGGATGFDKTITVRSIYGDTAGTISVADGTTKLGEAYITLALDGSDLTFTISEYNLQNKPDDGTNDFLWTKKDGWNDANILVKNFITGDREINLDERGTIDKEINNVHYHNMFGNDGTKKDTGDVAKIDVNTPAKLTFTIDSTAAGTFYVYEDGFDKKGKRTQITVAKVTVKAGQTTALKDVCLTATGKYYVAMTAKNVKKAGTEGLYNVNVTTDKFFVDADDNDNNTAKDNFLALVERNMRSIVMDGDLMLGSTTCTNFVGLGDSIDYLKLDLYSNTSLSFSVTGEGDGKAKFTIWKQAVGTTGKLSKVTSVSLPAKKAYAATTKAQFLDTSKYTYYVSMECTDAAKGKGVYYNVAVTDDSVFFDSDDDGKNDVLYDKKAKAFYGEDAEHHFETTNVGGGTKAIKLDSDPVGDTDYENFVGYGDPADYAKIKLTTSGDLYFKLKASGNATFTIYEKSQDKKGNDTLKAIQTTKLTLAKGKTTVEATTDLIADLAAGEYYVSMTAKSTKANASGSVFYNVTANLNPSVASPLSMPETDTLGISDALSFGSCDADALASASASLADLNEKSDWLNIASLA